MADGERPTFRHVGLGPFPDADRLAQAVTAFLADEEVLRPTLIMAGKIVRARRFHAVHYGVGPDGHSALLSYHEIEARRGPA